MKRSRRTTRVHVSVPKLRIKSKKTSSEEGSSISDNISEHRKMGNVDQYSEDLVTSYVQSRSSATEVSINMHNLQYILVIYDFYL